MNGSWYCTVPPEHAGKPPYLETFVSAYHSLTGRTSCDDIAADDILHSELCHRLVVHTVLHIQVDRIMLQVKAAQEKGEPMPADAALLKANYDSLRTFVRGAVAQKPDWPFAEPLEANLSSFLTNLGEPVLRKALAV